MHIPRLKFQQMSEDEAVDDDDDEEVFLPAVVAECEVDVWRCLR